MNIIVTVEYNNLFEDNPTSFEKLISGVNINSIVQTVSIMNAQLYKDAFNDEKQLKLLRIWLDGQTDGIADNIIGKFHELQKTTKAALFSTHHLLGFLHLSLNTFQKKKKHKFSKGLAPEEMLKMLKAYVFFMSKRDTDIDIRNIPPERFYERTWPIMMSQFELNSSNNHFITMVKSMCFFNYFKEENKTNCNVNTFLRKTGFRDGNNFSYENLNLIQEATSSLTEQNLRGFRFISSKNMIPFYESMSINAEKYSHQNLETENLKGLKESPLYRLNNSNVFMVIDWNLFANKFYDGLIFDFYHRSGIKTAVKNDFTSHYKPKVAQMTEKFLFQKLITFIFSNQRAVVKFDNEEISNNFPDAYVRIGKRIFLFEIKDALFSAKALNSREYKDIKGVLDQKYNTNKKGTGQIAKQIEFLQLNSFEDKSIVDLGLKNRNLIIYPIIVYTDQNFGLPGMESYLNEELQEKIVRKNLVTSYGNIKRLSFIHINFFIKHLLNLRDKEFHLIKLIDRYEKQINKNHKNYKKIRTLENHFKYQKSFQDISNEILPYKNDKGRLYPKFLFEELGLMSGFE